MIPKKHDELEEDVIGFDENDSLESKISIKSIGFIFNTLSTNLYSSPISSIVRELASNCHDSHTRAKVNKPILIGFDKDENYNEYVYFKDQGLGLTPTDISETYIQLGESLSRKVDTVDDIPVLGMFGIGSKSPFSITNSFTIRSITEGVLREYDYVKISEYGVPKLDKLFEYETDEPNGFEVRIPLSTDKFPNKYSNINNFIEGFKSQLTYFENIYFKSNLSYQSLDILNSQYNIYEYKTFKYRSNIGFNAEMHISYGKAVYPIQWSKLGISRINTPVGLKIPMDSIIEPTPPREDIKYTEDSIKYLIERINECKQEIIELYEKEYIITKDLFEYEELRKTGSGFITLDEGITLNVLHIINKAKVKYYLEDEGIVKIIPRLDVCFDLILTKAFKIEQGSRTTKNINNRLQTSTLLSAKVDYKNDIIKNKFINNALIIRKKSFFKFKHFYREVLTEFGIKREYPKNILGRRHIVKLIYDDIIRNFKEHSKPYSSIKVPQEFIDANKVSRIITDKSIVKYVHLNSFYDSTLKDKTREITVENLNKHKGLFIYGDKDDKELLEKVSEMLPSSPKPTYKSKVYSDFVQIIYTSKSNFKHFIFLNNSQTINVHDFMKGKNRAFVKSATGYKIELFLKQIYKKNIELITSRGYFDVNSKFDDQTSIVKILKHLNINVYSKLLKLIAYHKKSYIPFNREFCEDMLLIAEENNLFDKSIVSDYIEVREFLKGLELLQYTYCDNESLPSIVDYAKSKKKRLDLRHYLIKNYKYEEKVKEEHKQKLNNLKIA